MNSSNGNTRGNEVAQVPGPDAGSTLATPPEAGSGSPVSELATRTGQRKKPDAEEKRFVILAAGALIVALLVFVMMSFSHKPQAPKKGATIGRRATPTPAPTATPSNSSVPVTESSQAPPKGGQDGILKEQDVQRTAAPSQSKPDPFNSTGPRAQQPAPGASLGSIPPFDNDHWQAPPYGQTPVGTTESPESAKAERDLLEKPSLVFVRSSSAVAGSAGSRTEHLPTAIGLGLPTGTRLRARLETTATSAIKLPAVAVIEYNYERNGQILIPAGAKAFGHVEQVDRTGYMSIRFDTLMMPDGTQTSFEGVATNLQLAPLRGRVEGKNTGKGILARSFSGLGQVGALFVGHSNLNQPLSEQDLVRQQVATNIGDTSDREITRLAVTEHIVVSVPAGTPIYVVLEQTTKQNLPLVPAAPSGSQPVNPQNQELIQFLQKQLSSQPSSSVRAEQ